jgi:ribosome-associated protein
MKLRHIVRACRQDDGRLNCSKNLNLYHDHIGNIVFFTKTLPLTHTSEARKLIPDSDELNALIIDSITDIKGKHITQLDLRNLDDAPADFFIVCEGDSNTQVRGIAENIKYRLKKEAGVLPSHYEGVSNARWVCIDYFDTVVHVFYPEARVFYGLEELWSDAEITEYTHL